MNYIQSILTTLFLFAVVTGTRKVFIDLYAKTHPFVAPTKSTNRSKIIRKSSIIITRSEMSHFYAQADALFQEKQSPHTVHALYIAFNLRSSSRFLKRKKRSAQHFAAQSLLLATDCRKNCVQKGTFI